MEELVQKLIFWIREKVLEAGGKGIVVGMSGGLDSSVTAILCQQALPENTLGVIMPCHSDKTDERHALAVSAKFHIPTITIVLDKVFDVLLKVLPTQKFDKDTEKLAEANLKPRLRMLTLYYLANRLGYLVVGSSNKSEFSVGYFTKYGDGGVDLLPLGDLTKGQVRELALYLGVPKEIIEKPPSAGLWHGQTDEKELGLSYEELDRYLATGEATSAVKEKVETRANLTKHKRCLPPIATF